MAAASAVAKAQAADRDRSDGSARQPQERSTLPFYTPWIGSMLSPRKSLPPGGAETQILMLAKALAARGSGWRSSPLGCRPSFPARSTA